MSMFKEEELVWVKVKDRSIHKGKVTEVKYNNKMWYVYQVEIYEKKHKNKKYFYDHEMYKLSENKQIIEGLKAEKKYRIKEFNLELKEIEDSLKRLLEG